MARVLVVDDEPLIRMMLCEWLEELAHTVVGPADTEASALALLEAETPDIAILDMSLFGKDSIPVAEVLHKKGIPFALATGHRGDRLAPFNAQATLEKPYAFDDIVNAIQALLPR